MVFLVLTYKHAEHPRDIVAHAWSEFACRPRRNIASLNSSGTRDEDRVIEQPYDASKPAEITMSVLAASDFLQHTGRVATSFSAVSLKCEDAYGAGPTGMFSRKNIHR